MVFANQTSRLSLVKRFGGENNLIGLLVNVYGK
jgi:hypothetical protein